MVEWPVSKFMLEQGYTDSFREVHLDPSLTLEGTWGYLSQRDIISDRIDFVYYKGNNLKNLTSKIVMEDPIRQYDRIDIVLPMVAKSKTEAADPKREQLLNDIELPKWK